MDVNIQRNSRKKTTILLLKRQILQRCQLSLCINDFIFPAIPRLFEQSHSQKPTNRMTLILISYM